MERGSSFRRRITPVLLLVVLPLTALVCGQSPPGTQETAEPQGSRRRRTERTHPGPHP